MESFPITKIAADTNQEDQAIVPASEKPIEMNNTFQEQMYSSEPTTPAANMYPCDSPARMLQKPESASGITTVNCENDLHGEIVTNHKTDAQNRSESSAYSREYYSQKEQLQPIPDSTNSQSVGNPLCNEETNHTTTLPEELRYSADSQPSMCDMNVSASKEPTVEQSSETGDNTIAPAIDTDAIDSSEPVEKLDDNEMTTDITNDHSSTPRETLKTEDETQKHLQRCVPESSNCAISSQQFENNPSLIEDQLNVEEDSHPEHVSDCDIFTPSESHTVTSNSECVSSLFKNVVHVQAHTIAGEETDSETEGSSSASNTCALNECDGDHMNPIVSSSIEDIGREEEPIENDSLDPGELLVDETGDVQNYESMEGIEVGKMGNIVALDAPIIDPNDGNDVVEKEAYNSASDSPEESSASLETDYDTKSNGRARKNRTKSDSLTDEEQCAEESTSRQSHTRKRTSIRIVNVEKELLQGKKKKSRVHEVGSTRRSDHETSRRSYKSNEDPFGSWSSSTSDEIPNDMYFGTPDRVFTMSTKLHWQRQKQNGKKLSRSQRYESSSDSEDEAHVQRRMKKAEQIARLELPVYQEEQLQKMILKKQPKRDRFYDRSQDIPNDIYFGNVKVPLHILHATSSSSADEESWPRSSVKSSSQSDFIKVGQSTKRHWKEQSNYSKSSNYNHSRNLSSNTRSIQAMKEYMKMAGFRHVRYQKLWQDCDTTQDRAEAILRFLQEHGLQGEPTMEKCRELRKQIQLQKEVEVLDTSVIIDGGEGRVTRQRTKKVCATTTVKPSAIIPPEQREEVVDHQTAEDTDVQTNVSNPEQTENDVMDAEISPSPGDCTNNSTSNMKE